MSQTTFRSVLTLAVLVGLFAVPAMAFEGGAAGESGVAVNKDQTSYLKPLVAIGAGIVTIGAAMGIGRLASAAVESIARQPEAGDTIKQSMIIAAALIEGFTFFALIVCIIL